MRFEKEIKKLARRLVPYLKKAKETCVIEISHKFLNDDSPTYYAYCEYYWINGKLPDLPPYNCHDSKLWLSSYGKIVWPIKEDETPEAAADTIAYVAFDAQSSDPKDDDDDDVEYPIGASLEVSIDGEFVRTIDC